MFIVLKSHTVFIEMAAHWGRGSRETVACLKALREPPEFGPLCVAMKAVYFLQVTYSTFILWRRRSQALVFQVSICWHPMMNCLQMVLSAGYTRGVFRRRHFSFTCAKTFFLYMHKCCLAYF